MIFPYGTIQTQDLCLTSYKPNKSLANSTMSSTGTSELTKIFFFLFKKLTKFIVCLESLHNHFDVTLSTYGTTYGISSLLVTKIEVEKR